MNEVRYKCCVLVCSDRSFRGERVDETGPALRETLGRLGYEVIEVAVVPDQIDDIAKMLIKWVDQNVDLIVTSGGTGVGPRDVTPEATQSVIEREIPGLPQAALWFSLQRSPNAALSRAKAGIRGRTLIVNLPGSPRGAIEIMEYLDKPIRHAIPIIHGHVIE